MATYLCHLHHPRARGCAGGQSMERLYSFSFESRTWTSRQCRKLLEPWAFGHAARRKRSLFAYGSAQGESGALEVAA